MKSERHVTRWVAAVTVAVVAVLVPIATGGGGVRAATTLASGGEFHPLSPARIYDSRVGLAVNEANPGPKQLGAPEPQTFDIPLLGQGGIPTGANDVLAVVVNITVTEPTVQGYLEAYGKGAKPAVRTSIINFVAGQTIPNVAIVRPGADGMLTIGMFGQNGTAHVVVDVFGWFSTSNYVAPTTAQDDGSRLFPITPARVLDTRDGTGQNGAVAPIGQQSSITLQIRGVNSVNPALTAVVPNDPKVTGVLLNVVGITDRPGGRNTHLAIVPDDPGGGIPSTSNLNLPPATTKANLVFAPIGNDGNVHIYNNQGQTDVVADVVGYLKVVDDNDQTRQGRVVPLSSPYRTFDTREAAFGKAPLGPGQAEIWSFADFAASVSIGADQVGKQSAVIGNLTAAELKRQYPSVRAASYLTAFPGDAGLPGSSNLNTVEGPPVPNMAVLTYSKDNQNTVKFFNMAGYQDYLFDASAVVLAD